MDLCLWFRYCFTMERRDDGKPYSVESVEEIIRAWFAVGQRSKTVAKLLGIDRSTVWKYVKYGYPEKGVPPAVEWSEERKKGWVHPAIRARQEALEKEARALVEREKTRLAAQEAGIVHVEVHPEHPETAPKVTGDTDWKTSEGIFQDDEEPDKEIPSNDKIDKTAAGTPKNKSDLRLPTLEVQNKIVFAIRAGATVYAAGGYVGVSRPLLTSWIIRGQALLDELALTGKSMDDFTLEEKALADFKSALDSALAQFEVGAVGQIRKASNEAWTAAAWLLERRFPDRYARRDKVMIQREVEATMSAMLDRLAKVLPRRTYREVLVALSNDGGDASLLLEGQEGLPMAPSDREAAQ